MPFVLWVDGAGRSRGSAGQHTDVGMEALYAQLPGTKVVAPSNAYDAKGLLITAVRDPDPVIYLDYGEVKSGEQPDVPDEAYEVPLGKAEIRQQGHDLTLVAWAPATVDVKRALPDLAKAGISVEFIDPRSLKPLDVDALVASARKTRRLACACRASSLGCRRRSGRTVRRAENRRTLGLTRRDATPTMWPAD